MITPDEKMIQLKNNITENTHKKKKMIIPQLKLVKKENNTNIHKYRIQYDISSNTDKDEMVVLPDNALGNRIYEKDENNNSQPKVMKVFRKLI